MSSFIALCMAVVVCFAIPSHALAASCSSQKLPDNIKKILLDHSTIPIISSDIGDAATLRNLLISFNAKTGGTVETGKDFNLADLQDANGYAHVELQAKKLSEIQIIKSYLAKTYPDAASQIKVSNVNTSLSFIDATGKEVGTHTFKLEEGKNDIPLCEFGKFKDEIKKIGVKVKSFITLSSHA